ncbi:MAG: hypothetical protein M9897_07550 [Brumimicrobium sp.]|nr:hypothetical protein [Brumimicrobium sp.]
MNRITIIFAILSLITSGCHYRILSSSWSNHGQFYPPILSEQTYKVYQQPTPFDYVEILYLGEDSTFVQIVAGQLNLDPIKGTYEIKHGRLIFQPDNSDRNKVNTVYFDKTEIQDSIMFTAFSTWDYQIPIEMITFEYPDSTIHENFFFAGDTVRLLFPRNFDTIKVYSTYLDNRPVHITSNMLRDNNLVSIYFGMSYPDSYRIDDNEKWRFSINKNKLRHQTFSMFRKRHPYYYQGEIEIKKDL